MGRSRIRRARLLPATLLGVGLVGACTLLEGPAHAQEPLFVAYQLGERVRADVEGEMTSAPGHGATAVGAMRHGLAFQYVASRLRFRCLGDASRHVEAFGGVEALADSPEAAIERAAWTFAAQAGVVRRFPSFTLTLIGTAGRGLLSGEIGECALSAALDRPISGRCDASAAVLCSRDGVTTTAGLSWRLAKRANLSIGAGMLVADGRAESPEVEASFGL